MIEQRVEFELTGAGFTVRPVSTDPGELAAVRAHVVRVLEEDLKHGYIQQWHYDIDDIPAIYIDDQRSALFVAVDDESADVIGTIATRPGGPNSPPHPDWVAARYLPPERTAQIYRAYIHSDHRRRGVGSLLVSAIRRFIDEAGGYEVIYLHTDPTNFDGGVGFWNAMPTRSIYDGRGQAGSQAVHWELAFPDGDFRKQLD